ncbi:hypothetical protein E2C01_085111 [Portunus trituberculatus]|uniref:Uncharacterized protein n=1 Tax=Portunus trituberculatus TaxID=210409 RepID=A0A5B7IX25_PORTR|nr:hypothetical protein [Portunus trituberculatus]
MMAANTATIMGNIPEHHDGHVLSQAGLTPLHSAALFGAPSRAVEALLGRGVSPHVITPNNMTPADLARQKGHDTVIKGLLCHNCEQRYMHVKSMQPHGGILQVDTKAPRWC